ncbi:RNA 2',3'-cyclic phosphodiesterase, partial [Candidatus Peregrinibacteria bacterium]|nr:RNA 2',3'-cyclic phosphodiesterase [Candidatus Peregrinibacteria bacterium]
SLMSEICAKYKPIKFKLDKVDGFPNNSNPNIIVVKAIDESGQAEKMQKELANALRQLGIQIDDKPWHLHITIGRNKFGEEIRGLEKVSIEPIEWTVNEVILFESDLLPSGPRYTTLWISHLTKL